MSVWHSTHGSSRLPWIDPAYRSSSKVSESISPDASDRSIPSARWHPRQNSFSQRWGSSSAPAGEAPISSQATASNIAPAMRTRRLDFAASHSAAGVRVIRRHRAPALECSTGPKDPRDQVGSSGRVRAPTPQPASTASIFSVRLAVSTGPAILSTRRPSRFRKNVSGTPNTPNSTAAREPGSRTYSYPSPQPSSSRNRIAAASSSWNTTPR